MNIKKIKEKFEHLPLKKMYIISFVLNIFFIIIAFLAQFILPPEIPLFYGMPQNNLQIAPSYLLFLPSGISLIILIINLAISNKINDIYLKKTMAIASLLVSFLSAITIAKIIFLIANI